MLTAPDPEELQLPTSDDWFKTATLPEINKFVSQIENKYLAFAYERIWSILIYMAYADFQKINRTLKGPHRRKNERIKEQLVGSGVKFTEIHRQGDRWKDLVKCSDCGILLLVKQRFRPVIATHKSSIVWQYITTIKDKRTTLCTAVRNILKAFSPDDRVSISYYTRAYKSLSDLITPIVSPQLALVCQDLWSDPDEHMKIDFCTFFEPYIYNFTESGSCEGDLCPSNCLHI